MKEDVFLRPPSALCFSGNAAFALQDPSGAGWGWLQRRGWHPDAWGEGLAWEIGQVNKFFFFVTRAPCTLVLPPQITLLKRPSRFHTLLGVLLVTHLPAAGGWDTVFLCVVITP